MSDRNARRTDGPQVSATERVRKFGPPAFLAVVALLFVFQNTNETQFSFLWFDFDAPLWIILLISMIVGAVIFWGAARRRAKRRA
jgi:uncharacterized integral membrane protein